MGIRDGIFKPGTWQFETLFHARTLKKVRSPQQKGSLLLPGVILSLAFRWIAARQRSNAVR